LKLRRNNWDSDTYQFDEVLTQFASQKRVYEVVAKPVVESVLEGYNGTVMAYGQTGTGKTFTLGRLGDEDTADRGIMVRAMEDILSDISPEHDSVTVSYLQLYMETVQDLLTPSNYNILIMEDPKSGDVSVPGATVVEIRDQQSFEDLLRTGEAHRFAANTKLNTESSRSHAILMVNVKRTVYGRQDKESALSNENGNGVNLLKGIRAPVVRKSKLVVVDLAGSERIDKSGSEGHALEEAKSINLSLSALGKCINALAENSSHVPIRDSKLTRLLRDSFGGTARTSLVVTIGPSPRHRGETASTISFGQRAMKVENMLKLKEEFDYKSLCRRYEMQIDKLIADNERNAKAFQNAEEERDRMVREAQDRAIEAQNKLSSALERTDAERSSYQKEYMDAWQKLEEQQQHLQQQKAVMEAELKDKNADYWKEGQVNEIGEELAQVKWLLQKEIQMREHAEEEVKILKSQIIPSVNTEMLENAERVKLTKRLEDEVKQRSKLEEEIKSLKHQLLQLSFEADETRRVLDRGGSGRNSTSSDSAMNTFKTNQVRDAANGQKATIAKLFEQVGLQKILSLLESEDVDVRVHAVKVVANLAAEEANQERIVEAGGLNSLLMLLRSSEDETIRRVAAGAIANLAMNETNQELIMNHGGIGLLSRTADEAEDPQTLRMVAGAIANLCGNDKLQIKLRSEGGIRALLGMVRCGHPDVLAQVARGIANFAKCESRASTQGIKTGRSLLIDDGTLPWIVQNANNEASPIRRHIELALCHLAQHEVNAKDLIAGGALWELVRISRDCSREDIRNLAHRTLVSSPIFQTELRRSHTEL
jgi:kinesin family protein 5